MENFDFLNSFAFPYINLAIFLVLAVWVLKGPILGALRSKRQNYMVLVDSANKAREEAERKHAELSARLQSLDAELAKIRSEVKSSAEEESKAIVASAEQLAEHLKREAKRIADAEVTAAKEAIRQDIMAQVRKQTADELSRTLDDSRQHKIVQQSLGGLTAVKGGQA